MLLQTNSYVVPKDKRTEHARLVKRFRQVMARLGLPDFEVYEQAGPNWSTEVGGRFVQIMRFRDRAHQQAVRDAEQADGGAQDLVREFCELVNFAYQHQQGIATTAFYLGAHASTAAPAGGQKQLPDESAAPVGLANTAVTGDAPLILNGEPHDELDLSVDDEITDVPPPATEPFPKGTPARTSSNRDEH